MISSIRQIISYSLFVELFHGDAQFSYSLWLLLLFSFFSLSPTDEECDVGDVVEIRVSSPYSKTKHFTLHKILRKRLSLEQGSKLYVQTVEEAQILSSKREAAIEERRQWREAQKLKEGQALASNSTEQSTEATSASQPTTSA